MSFEHSVVEKCLHTSVLSPPSPAHEPLARLLRWAAAQGVVGPKLALDPADPRRFLAGAPISPLEPIITLPQNLLMHAGTALSDAVYGPAFRALRAEMAAVAPAPVPRPPPAPDRTAASTGGCKPLGTPAAHPGPPVAATAAAAAAGTAAVPHSYWDNGGLSDRDLLCMLLILERARGAASAWAPYIDILPTSYDDPAWWDAPSLALLRGTRISRAVAAYRPGLERLAAAMRRLAEIHREIQIQTQGERPAAKLGKAAYATVAEGEDSPAGRGREGSDAMGGGEVQCGTGGGGGGRGDEGPGAGGPADDPLLSGWAVSLEAARWARSAVWSRSFTVRGLMADGGAAGGGGGGEGGGRRHNGTKGRATEGGLEGCLNRREMDTMTAGESTVRAAREEEEAREVSLLGGKGEERRLHVCQVPVLDMIDHAAGCEAVWHTGARGRDDFVWARREAVEQGAVLSNNYGSKDNQELLLAYGFVLRPNRHDYVSLTLTGGAADAAAAPDSSSGSRSRDGDEAVEADEEAGAIQVAAEAVQRRLVAAAAGLVPELRMTLEDPLPERLLQATRVAMSSGPRLHFATSDALTAETEAEPPELQPPHPAQSTTNPAPPAVAMTTAATAVVATAAAANATVPDSVARANDAVALNATAASPEPLAGMPAVWELLQPYDAASELRMLSTVIKQLEARLAALVSNDQEVCDILDLMTPLAALQGPAGPNSPIPAWPSLLLPTDWLGDVYGNDRGRNGTSGSRQVGMEERRIAFSGWLETAEAAAEQLGLGRHARMALAVVNSQRAVLTAAMWEARKQMAAVIERACVAAAVPALCSVAIMRSSAPLYGTDGIGDVGDGGGGGDNDGNDGAGPCLELLQEPPSPSQQQQRPDEAAEAPGVGVGTNGAQMATVLGGGGGRGGGWGTPGALLPHRVAVRTRRAVAAGSELLRISLLEHCITAPSAELLTARLVLMAAALALPQHQHHQHRQHSQQQQEQQPHRHQQQQQQPNRDQQQQQHEMDSYEGVTPLGVGVGLGPKDLGGSAATSEGPKAAQELPSLTGGSHMQQLLLRQLLRHMGPSPPVRLMTPPSPGTVCAAERGGEGGGRGDWWGDRCLELLEGTPTGVEYEQATVELQDDFNNFRRRLPSLASSLTREAPLGPHWEPEPRSGSRSLFRCGSGSGLGPGQGPRPEAGTGDATDTTATTGASNAVVEFFLSGPLQSAFWLYCWAREVVERCSLELRRQEDGGPEGCGLGGIHEPTGPRAHDPEDQQQDLHQRHHQRPPLHLIAPVLWALPKELLTAAVRLEEDEDEVLDGHRGTPTPSRRDPDPSSAVRSQRGARGVVVVVVRAMCPLRSDLLMHPTCLLMTVGCDVDRVMARYGPESLAAICPAAAEAEAEAATTDATEVTKALLLWHGGGGGGDPTLSSGAGKAARRGRMGMAAAAAVAAASGNFPVVPPVHSLELLPAPDDTLRSSKLKLVAALGLGCNHHLGPGGRGQGLVEATLSLLLLRMVTSTGRDPEGGEEPAEGGCEEARPAAAGSLWEGLLRLMAAAAAEQNLNLEPQAADGRPAGSGSGGGSAVSTPPFAAAVRSGTVSGDGYSAADTELLTSARRAVRQLRNLYREDNEVARSARKLLRGEVKDATKRLAEGRREDVDTRGHAAAVHVLEGVRRYRQMYGIVLDDLCDRLITKGPIAGSGRGGTKRRESAPRGKVAGGTNLPGATDGAPPGTRAGPLPSKSVKRRRKA